MDSFQALIPSLVLLSALVIPGLAIAFLLPMARLTRIAVAPLISGAVLAVSTLVSGVWPGTWGGRAGCCGHNRILGADRTRTPACGGTVAATTYRVRGTDFSPRMRGCLPVCDRPRLDHVCRSG